jgi:hypothetical protein
MEEGWINESKYLIDASIMIYHAHDIREPKGRFD